MAPPVKFYKSELTVSGESSTRGKNLIGVLISVLVLILISSMIVAAIVIINPEIVTFPGKAFTPREAVTLEEALLGELYPNDFTFQWLKKDPKSDELLYVDYKNLKTIKLPINGHKFNKTTSTQDNYLQLERSTQQIFFQPNHFEPNATTLISNNSLLASIDFQGFKISPSKRFLLVWTNKNKQFRHTFTAKYFIYDIEHDLISLISTQQQQKATSEAQSSRDAQTIGNSYEHLDSATEYLNEHDDGNEFNRFQLVDWFSSSSQSDADSLILIQNNDIYLLKNVSAADRSAPSRLTFTGKENEIFNGIPDWLYEEEILADVAAYQVSPKATNLAYMSFNDSLVDLMPFSIYGNSQQIIPQTKRIRYSKAGRPNPRVSVHVIEQLTSGQANDVTLQLPQDLAQRQHYIYRIQWLTNEKLVLSWLNRNQNESYYLICAQEKNWLCEKNLFQSSPNGWLDVSDNFMPLDENNYLALLLKDEGEDVGKFKHIAKVSISPSYTFKFLTSGRREVISIDGVDEEKGIVYYTSSVENEPGQRQVYYVKEVFENKHSNEEPNSFCLTCNLYPEECLYNNAKLSPSAEHYIFECLGPGVPRYELRTTQDNQISDGNLSDSTLLWPVEDNQALREKLTNVKAMPLTMRLKVPLANTNYSANVLMLLPPQLGYATTFRPAPPPPLPLSGVRVPYLSPLKRISRGAFPIQSGGVEQALHLHFTPDSIRQYTDQLPIGQQYPMVVDVYAGPGSQKVDYRFGINFGHYMASSRRAIYVMIDGRGSGFQGTKRLYELYKKFGTVEIQDQIDVASYLTRNYPFIDPSKVAIWGWSYGGYAAAMALAQSNKLAIQDLQDYLSQQRDPDNQAKINLKSYNNNSTLLQREYKTKALQNTNSANNPNLVVQPNSVFECAVSVAPVTDWIYYDTAYTERYMNSPYMNDFYDNFQPNDHNDKNSIQQSIPAYAGLSNQINLLNRQSSLSDQKTTNHWTPLNQTLDSYSPQVAILENIIKTIDLNERYKMASLIKNIPYIDKKRFLLIHGTSDDNVHFQQSIMLMKKLIQRNILFESRLYPDQDHSISNKADKLHLGSTLSNFFAECFDMAY